MFNCIINNKSTYLYKSTPNFENQILYPVPTNSLNNIKSKDKSKKKKRIDYIKENTNTKHSSEITTSSNQNTKVNNTMKIYHNIKKNKNILYSTDNLINNIFENKININQKNIKSIYPNKIRNSKLNQKQFFTFNQIDSPLLILKFQYLNNEQKINVFLNDDGLKIAVKINSIFNLNLNAFELEKCGLIITEYINYFIDIKSKNNEVNNFGVIINLKEIVNKCRKKKIKIEFKGRYYNYYISNSIDEINEVVEDIFKKINKNNKYKHNDLKQEIKLSILTIMNNQGKNL